MQLSQILLLSEDSIFFSVAHRKHSSYLGYFPVCSNPAHQPVLVVGKVLVTKDMAILNLGNLCACYLTRCKALSSCD